MTRTFSFTYYKGYLIEPYEHGGFSVTGPRSGALFYVALTKVAAKQWIDEYIAGTVDKKPE